MQFQFEARANCAGFQINESLPMSKLIRIEHGPPCCGQAIVPGQRNARFHGEFWKRLGAGQRALRVIFELLGATLPLCRARVSPAKLFTGR